MASSQKEMQISLGNSALFFALYNGCPDSFRKCRFQGEAMTILNASAVPDQLKSHDDPFEDQYPDHTLYFQIELQVNRMGGRKVPPVTAVFAPDPKQLKCEVDVLLWFHGDKDVWSKK